MNNKKMSFLAVLVMLVAVTAYSVSGTYAKYTSTFTGSDSARVAKWAFDIGGSEADMANETFTFNLFSTINDANVATGTDENIIAPGTTGSFDIDLLNKSEVTAEYYVELAETENTSSIPVEYSMDNGTTWLSLADINTALKAAKATLAMNAGSESTTTITWRWAYEKTETTPGENEGDPDVTTVDSARDEADTTLGIDGTATITVEASVVVTQVV